MSKIQVVWFRDLTRWDTEYFMGNHSLHSKFKLEYLSKILTPRKEKIKPNEYDGVTPIVAKIPFQSSYIELRKEPRTRMDMYTIYKGDLLVSNINFHQGAIAICKENKIYASTHYQPYIIDNSLVNSEFLVLVLKQTSYQQYISSKKTRGIKTESNFNFIKNLQIPLPPLEIQNKIVADIHAIQTKIKALQVEEKRLKDEIETYIYITLGLQKPQSVQKQKVFVVRFKNLERWDTTYNQNKTINLYSSNTKFSKSKYPLVALGEICTTNVGLTYEPKNISKTKQGIAVLRSNNIQNGKIDYNDLVYVDNTDIPNNKIANKGDLIICVRNGSANLVGKTAMIEKNGMSFGAFMAIIRSKYNPYLYHFLQTDIFRNSVFEARTSGINQISQSDIKKFKIPLPPLQIQKEMVENIEQKTSYIQEIAKQRIVLHNSIESQLQKMLID